MAKPSPKETGPAGSPGKLLLQLSEYVVSGSFPFVAKSARRMSAAEARIAQAEAQEPGPRVSTTLSVLGVHGFGARLVVGLINHGLVMIMYERVRAGSTMIDVTNVPDRA
jgi:hypothetical protein